MVRCGLMSPKASSTQDIVKYDYIGFHVLMSAFTEHTARQWLISYEIKLFAYRLNEALTALGKYDPNSILKLLNALEAEVTENQEGWSLFEISEEDANIIKQQGLYQTTTDLFGYERSWSSCSHNLALKVSVKKKSL